MISVGDGEGQVLREASVHEENRESFLPWRTFSKSLATWALERSSRGNRLARSRSFALNVMVGAERSAVASAEAVAASHKSPK